MVGLERHDKKWPVGGWGSHPVLLLRAGPALQGHTVDLERGGEVAEKTKYKLKTRRINSRSLRAAKGLQVQVCLQEPAVRRHQAKSHWRFYLHQWALHRWPLRHGREFIF